jgi:hypothetical protein
MVLTVRIPGVETLAAYSTSTERWGYAFMDQLNPINEFLPILYFTVKQILWKFP